MLPLPQLPSFWPSLLRRWQCLLWVAGADIWSPPQLLALTGGGTSVCLRGTRCCRCAGTDLAHFPLSLAVSHGP